MEFLEALKNRRSIYNIDRNIKVKEEEIISLVEQAMIYTPSAFNSQSQRAVLVFGERHEQVWEMVKQAIKKIVSPEDFKNSEIKINSFKKGYGTVLFFDDKRTTEGLMEKFPLYKENFYRWSIEQSGMIQSNVWVGLESIGIGASLQHYNELIEKDLKEAFNIDDSWQLIAQMPFGNLVEVPEEKNKMEIEKRFIVLR